MAKSLKDLPFPIEELTWDRLSEVQKCLKLSKAEAFTVLCHVLGTPPKPLSAGSGTASGLLLINSQSILTNHCVCAPSEIAKMMILMSNSAC